jgi:hypothetical protein
MRDESFDRWPTLKEVSSATAGLSQDMPKRAEVRVRSILM